MSCCLRFKYTLFSFIIEKSFTYFVSLEHTQKYCLKNLNMLKLWDVYIVRILKLWFNLFNNLPYQFNHILLWLTDANTHYPFRNKTYNFLLVRHEFVKSSTGYNIVRIINNTTRAITAKISTHFWYGFTTYRNMQILNSYNLDYSILDCFICSNNEV